MRVRVVLFAAAADLAGTHEAELELPGSAPVSMAPIRAALARQWPALMPLLPVCALAVDGVYAGEEQTTVPDGAEVAVIPPVSCGEGPPDTAAPPALTEAPID